MFGTRLTRVTRLLRDRDRDRALARVADAVNDWAGGTRIGESFREFNLHWARRTLRTSGVVIVVSDGWDRGDPALVATETARLRRNCHRLVWLNPLAGTPGYQPLAGGMRAAFPYIDDFLPAGTVASLERLGEILAGVRASDSGRGRRGGRARRADARRAAPDVTLRDARSRRRIRSSPAPAAAAAPTRQRRSAPMKELLADARRLAGATASASAGPSSSGRSARAPRPEGAVLLRAADGRIAGSVSGGCVEGAAAEEIERARRDGHARVIRYGISDEEAWDVGLACGGTIDVLVEPAVPAVGRRRRAPDVGARAVAIAAAGRRAARRVRAVTAGRRRAARAAGRRPRRRDRSRARSARRPPTPRSSTPPARPCSAGTSRTVELGGRSLFVEAFPVRPRLVIVGAVEVARSLVGIARELGYETVVVDGRAAFATPERFPDVDRLIVGWPDEVADEIGLGPDDAVAVLTHDVKFDEPAIVEALRRGCRYVGAVGSRKTQGDRRERLREAGVGDEDLARLRGPIGLDLGGRAPAETALAIMAEVVASRYGGSGGRCARGLAAAPRTGRMTVAADRPGGGGGEPVRVAQGAGPARRPADPRARPRRRSRRPGSTRSSSSSATPPGDRGRDRLARGAPRPQPGSAPPVELAPGRARGRARDRAAGRRRSSSSSATSRGRGRR